ncbi:MAG: hypothetical protein M0P70_11065 [Desulfobulbaceae bacterium]|nr:hypothetical protein [Desulfobulbaceae bacterium]
MDVCKGGGPPLPFFFIYGALVMKRAVAAENDLIISNNFYGLLWSLSRLKDLKSQVVFIAEPATNGRLSQTGYR